MVLGLSYFLLTFCALSDDHLRCFLLRCLHLLRRAHPSTSQRRPCPRSRRPCRASWTPWAPCPGRASSRAPVAPRRALARAAPDSARAAPDCWGPSRGCGTHLRRRGRRTSRRVLHSLLHHHHLDLVCCALPTPMTAPRRASCACTVYECTAAAGAGTRRRDLSGGLCVVELVDGSGTTTRHRRRFHCPRHWRCPLRSACSAGPCFEVLLLGACLNEGAFLRGRLC